jgi:periplasmic divalent cation tolerance protein
MTEYCVIYCTVSSDQEGRLIADSLVQKNLAACVNMITPVRSLYTWKGETCDNEERLLIIKSRASIFEKVRNDIRALHSYDVPEIIAMPILQGDDEYIKWMDENIER